MKLQDPSLLLQPAPFLRQGVTTPRIMWDVLIALAPLIAAATWFFGPGALLVLLAATAGAAGMEWLFQGRKVAALKDGSAILTGLLLGLTLPPSIPLWMAVLGGVVAIGMGRLVWGGLGQNLFNPALVGRAFLQAAFPITLTTWAVPHTEGSWWSLEPGLFAAPLMHPQVDAVTAATPLGLHKFAGEGTALIDLVLGTTGGSLGETSALLIVLGGIWMVARRSFDWRIPVGILVTVAALSGALWAIDPVKFSSPQVMLTSGGLLLGAVFMATDPVTSPTTPRGAWIFAALIGLLVVLIRTWGGLPEGVMYAILLGNATAPLLERLTQPRPFGRRRKDASS